MRALLLLAGAVLIALLWWVLGPEPRPPSPGTSGTSLRDAGAMQAGGSGSRDAIGQASDRAGLPAAPPPSTGALQARVVWRDDRTPVPSFSLRLSRGVSRRNADLDPRLAATLTTDAAGIARVEDLQPGPYWIHATKEMLAPAEVFAGETRRVEIALERFGQLRVQVVDEGGTPVSGAAVHAVGGFLVARSYRGRTDAEGRLAFDTMGPNVSVFAEQDGRGRSESAEVVTFPGDTAELLLTLGSGARELRGLVTDGAGRPVSGAEVAVAMPFATPRAVNRNQLNKGYDDGSRPRLTTDADGRFRLGNVLPGEVACSVRGPGFAPQEARATLPATGGEEIVIRLGPGARVAGIVRDPAGAPVAGASVDLVSVSYTEQPWSQSHTDRQGRFSIDSLKPGTLELWAGHPEIGEATTELEVLAGEAGFWEPRLDPGGVFEGEVVDQAGEPLAGLTVTAVGRGRVSRFSRSVTAPDGAFRIQGCEDTAYRVTVLESPSLNAQALVVLEEVRPDTGPLRIVVPDAVQASGYIEARFVRPPGFESWRILFQIGSDRPGWSMLQAVPASGAFRIGPLVPGRYELLPIRWYSLGGFTLPAVEVGPGEEVDLGEVHVPSPTWLELDIRYADGGAVEESTVRLSRPGAPGPSALFDSWTPAGLPAMRGALEPGTYQLRLAAPHHLPWEAQVELAERRTTVIEATVERARPVLLTLEVPDGVAIPGTLEIALHRDGRPDDRTELLFQGERTLAAGLGTYTATIRDPDSELTGSVRFTVSDLARSEQRVRLPARR